MFKGKHPAGAAKADFDVINDQEDVVAIAQCPQFGHEIGRRHDIAAVGLDSFDKNGRDIFRRADGRKEIVFEVVEALIDEVVAEPPKGGR